MKPVELHLIQHEPETASLPKPLLDAIKTRNTTFASAWFDAEVIADPNPHSSMQLEADRRVSALQLIAASGTLDAPYQSLVRDSSRAFLDTKQAIARIVDTAELGVTHETKKLDLGPRGTLKITPQIAFDAGFTAGFDSKLKALKETPLPLGEARYFFKTCEGGQQDTATCASVGFSFGIETRRNQSKRP